MVRRTRAKTGLGDRELVGAEGQPAGEGRQPAGRPVLPKDLHERPGRPGAHLHLAVGLLQLDADDLHHGLHPVSVLGAGSLGQVALEVPDRPVQVAPLLVGPPQVEEVLWERVGLVGRLEGRAGVVVALRRVVPLGHLVETPCTLGVGLRRRLAVTACGPRLVRPEVQLRPAAGPHHDAARARLPPGPRGARLVAPCPEQRICAAVPLGEDPVGERLARHHQRGAGRRRGHSQHAVRGGGLLDDLLANAAGLLARTVSGRRLLGGQEVHEGLPVPPLP